MSWREITIGSFLKERPDKIKPDQANSLGLKRIEKIDFSGNIYLADNTSTRTDMILVKPGDLVISGINVAKGALAVYEGTEDILATIHYSSYEFDKSIIDIEYLKWFLASNIFMNILKEQVGGGIKTELKPKKFLPLKIKLPDINLQREIAKKINSVYNEIKALKETNEENYELISKLRQSILQEAVQGKLVPQDPNDEPASVLLERIMEEKERLIKEGKINKEKPLLPITEDEIPYELPKGWEWLRLGELCELITKGSSPKWQGVNYIDNENGVLFITSENVGNYKLILTNKKYLEWKFNEIEPRSILKKGDILMNIVGASIGRTAIFDLDDIANINQAVCLIRTIETNVYRPYLLYFFNSNVCINYMYDKQVDNARANLSMGNIAKFLIPFPPLNEQKRIVEKVDQLMALCDELEKNIEQSKKDSELLMQSVLQEAFKGV